MQVLDLVRRAFTGGGSPTGSALTSGGTRGIASPWATGTLTQIVVRDILGLDTVPVSRAEAMGIPAIAKARHRLCSDAARAPLVVMEGDAEVRDQSTAWLQRTSLPGTPQHRMVWTVDDLVFYGWSLWAVQRDGDGAITAAARVPFEWWSFGEDGRVVINGQPVDDPEQLVLIPGFHEGIVNFAPRTIRGARELETQWAERAANPIPAVELHQETSDALEPEEIEELVESWRDALRDNGGAVAYTPRSLTVKTHGTAVTDLLIEGRNAAAIDAARIVGVPAAVLDASNVNSTLTYETLQGRNLEYTEHSLSLYTGPVEARLSLDDVVPPGRRVRADTSSLTVNPPIPTGAPTED